MDNLRTNARNALGCHGPVTPAASTIMNYLFFPLLQNFLLISNDQAGRITHLYSDVWIRGWILSLRRELHSLHGVSLKSPNSAAQDSPE